MWAFDGWEGFDGWALPLAHLGLYCRFKNPKFFTSAKPLATDAQLTAEASTIINAATVHLKALKAAAKEVNKEVNTQVEVDNDEQSNSSDSEVLDEDVGMDIGNVVQSIE